MPSAAIPQNRPIYASQWKALHHTWALTSSPSSCSNIARASGERSMHDASTLAHWVTPFHHEARNRYHMTIDTHKTWTHSKITRNSEIYQWNIPGSKQTTQRSLNQVLIMILLSTATSHPASPINSTMLPLSLCVCVIHHSRGIWMRNHNTV